MNSPLSRALARVVGKKNSVSASFIDKCTRESVTKTSRKLLGLIDAFRLSFRFQFSGICEFCIFRDRRLNSFRYGIRADKIRLKSVGGFLVIFTDVFDLKYSFRLHGHHSLHNFLYWKCPVFQLNVGFINSILRDF